MFYSTFQFPESNERSREGDSANVRPEVEESLGDVRRGVGGEMWLLQQVVSKAGHHCRGPHQTVEQRHHLGKLGYIDRLTDHRAEQTTCNARWIIFIQIYFSRFVLKGHKLQVELNSTLG